MVGRGGALSIKMLRRTVSFENKDAHAGTKQGLGTRGRCHTIPPSAAPSQAASLDIPKKTKVFVDQTVRERDNPYGNVEGCDLAGELQLTPTSLVIVAAMHNAFQKDLYRIRLGAAKAFAKSLKTSSAPITTTHSMNISAQVW